MTPELVGRWIGNIIIFVVAALAISTIPGTGLGEIYIGSITLQTLMRIAAATERVAYRNVGLFFIGVPGGVAAVIGLAVFVVGIVVASMKTVV